MPEKKKYKVTLTDDEKKLLQEIMNKGKHGAQKRKRAHALLLTDEGYTDEETAERTGMHRRGIEELRRRFVEDGFESALEGKPNTAGADTGLVPSAGKMRRGLLPWYADRRRRDAPGGRCGW